MKKFVFCAGVLFCAPMIASAAVNFTTVEVEKYLENTACKKVAILDKIVKECK